jgi:hypothetical protein
VSSEVAETLPDDQARLLGNTPLTKGEEQMTRRPTPISSSPALAVVPLFAALASEVAVVSTLLPLRGLASNPGLDWSFLAADIDDPPATRAWFLAKLRSAASKPARLSLPLTDSCMPEGAPAGW